MRFAAASASRRALGLRDAGHARAVVDRAQVAADADEDLADLERSLCRVEAEDDLGRASPAFSSPARVTAPLRTVRSELEANDFCDSR